MERRQVRVKSLDEPNAWLMDKCVAYAKAHRHLEETNKTIWEMFEGEPSTCCNPRSPRSRRGRSATR